MKTIKKELSAVVINSAEDHQNLMLVPMMKLDNREIDYLVVNGIPFQRKDFEFKNGNFNNTCAIDTLIHAYMFKNMSELEKYINGLEQLVAELS